MAEAFRVVLTDIQGSVTEVYDENEKLVWKSGYTAFGIKAGETTDLIDFDGLYTSCDYDAETGLTYHWNRWRSENGANFISEDFARDGLNWYGYAGMNPIMFTDPTGMWTENGDGSFTAQQGDTLWGLQQETGRDWNTFDFQEKPESLQIGQTINVVKTPEKNSHPTIDSTKDAVNHYYNGNGEPTNLGENTINALKNSPEQKYNQKALSEGTAKSEIHRYGVDLTNNKGTYHVGDTVVTYDKSEGTKYRVVTYNAFMSDGFWDVLPGEGDGIGQKKELPGGTPYSYIPYSWTEVYKK